MGVAGGQLYVSLDASYGASAERSGDRDRSADCVADQEGSDLACGSVDHDVLRFARRPPADGRGVVVGVEQAVAGSSGDEEERSERQFFECFVDPCRVVSERVGDLAADLWQRMWATANGVLGAALEAERVSLQPPLPGLELLEIWAV